MMISRRFPIVAIRSNIRKMSNKSSILEADDSKSLTKFFHMSGMALAVLTPLAFVISPSKMNMPIDISLGILFPLHAHIALNAIVSDYVPVAYRSVARPTLLGVTVITLAGLLRLNFTGAGITETIKSVWRKKITKNSK